MDEVKGLNNVDSDGFSPVFGAGLSYALTDNLALRTEYQFTQSLGVAASGFTNHHLITMGVSWRFGFAPKPMPIIQEKIVEVIVVKEVEKQTFVISDVDSETLFAHDSSSLVNTQPLEEVLAFLVKHPSSAMTITGHTDSTGSNKYNQGLSERRATSVADYFMAKGIDKVRINVSGKGEEEPIADNSTEMGRAMNRRVEIIAQPFDIKSPQTIKNDTHK